MSFKNVMALGLAGEFRVMSELLLRGFNPAKSYLENGADLILENGVTVEVRCSHIYKQKSRKSESEPLLKYTLKTATGAHGYRMSDADFIIFWCIDDNWFFIIPKEEFQTHKGYYISKRGGVSKLDAYKDAWDLLRGKICH